MSDSAALTEGRKLEANSARWEFAMKHIIAALLVLALAALALPATARASSSYEGYYLYVSRYSGIDAGDDLREVQGITHDTTHWYITSTARVDYFEGAIFDAYLWKVPVTVDLHSDMNNTAGVTGVHLREMPGLTPPLGPLEVPNGYVHWGDLDHYSYNGVDYLVMPVTSPRGTPANGHLDFWDPAVVVLRASDLSEVGLALLPGADGTGQNSIGWCAINPVSGDLYTSNDRTTSLYRYHIPWADIARATVLQMFTVTWRDSVLLTDRAGGPLDLHNMQGG